MISQNNHQRRIICRIFEAYDEDGAMEILVSRQLKNAENRFKDYFEFSFKYFTFLIKPPSFATHFFQFVHIAARCIFRHYKTNEKKYYLNLKLVGK